MAVAARLAIVDHGPLEVVPRWTTNPDWLVSPGCHAKLIWLAETAEELRLTGAAGNFLVGPPAYVGIAHERIKPRASAISRWVNKLGV